MRTRTKNVPLLAAMASAGITGKQLAEKANLHPASLSQILNERVEPKPETVKRIASALEVSPSELFGKKAVSK